MEQSFSKTQLKLIWWSRKRLKYNIGLLIAGVIAFILYSVLGSILIAPYDNDFEITLFTILFQGFGYLLMIGIANLFYFLGPLLDIWFNKTNSDSFRNRLYNLGYWFSFGLPFLIPVAIVIQYFILYANK